MPTQRPIDHLETHVSDLPWLAGRHSPSPGGDVHLLHQRHALHHLSCLVVAPPPRLRGAAPWCRIPWGRQPIFRSSTVHVEAAAAQEDYGGGTKENGKDETGVGEGKATAQWLLWPATPSKWPGSAIGNCGSCFGGCVAGSYRAGGIEVAAVVAAAGIVNMLAERGLATIVRWNRFIGLLQRRHGSTRGLLAWSRAV